MIFAGLVIGNWSWLLPAGLLIALACVLLWRSYRNSNCALSVRLSCAALKAIGLLMLALCLIDPLWSGTRARPGANLFAVVADGSRSLTIYDAGAAEHRGSLLKRLVAGKESSWKARLGQDFDVRQYIAGDGLIRTDDFAELDFTSDASALGTALEALRHRLARRPLAGAVLFTDGNATDLDAAGWDFDGLPPVYPVIVGKSHGLKDIAINNVAVSETSFEDAPVTVRGNVAATGYEGTEIIGRLLNEQDEVIAVDVQKGGRDARSMTFRFQHRPAKHGISFYRLQVAAGEWEQLTNSPAVHEATIENNQRLIKAAHGRGPRRILYVSGRPNWEFKFLNRAVAGDANIELAALIRIAKREPKFDWRGRADESSNPLYRGFKPQPDEETERYDEPVFMRLNMADAAELRAGFPKTAERLFGFHAVILDDVEADFFTHDQMSLLEQFVSERGGGLLMLSGQESFRNGGYDQTPIARMLPVYLDRRAADAPAAGYRLELTREGWLQPWVRLRSTEAEERARIDAMPAFRTLNRLDGVKPGAAVLARVGDDAGESWPALVTQRYGRGRSAALTVGDMWRWRLQRERDSDDLEKAWRQMLRWLVADVPERIELLVDEGPARSGSAVKLRVRVHDDEFQPLDNAAVAVTVTPPEEKPIPIDAQPSLDQAGLFAATYVPRARGAYRASAVATDSEGNELGRAQAGWVSDPAAQEYRRIAPNRELMQRLADATGGEVVDADDLEQFVASLSARRAPVTEHWTFPLWHQSWVLMILIGCFAGEWGLRRWKGLP